MKFNNSLFELALDKLGCISIVDKDGKYEYVNDIWTDTFKIDREEAIGQYASNFFQDTNIKDVLSTGKSVICDYVKEEYDIIYTAYIPLIDEDEVYGVLIYNEIKDIVNTFGLRKWLLNDEDNMKQVVYKKPLPDKNVNKLIYLDDMKLKDKQDILVKETLVDALKRTKGNKAHAARILGISRTVIYDKLKKYNLM